MLRLKIGNKDIELTKPVDLNDWVKLEEAGLSVEELQKGNITMAGLRSMIWVVVVKFDPDTTLEWVGENINPNNMAEMTGVINSFFSGTPAKDNEKPKATKKKSAS